MRVNRPLCVFFVVCTLVAAYYASTAWGQGSSGGKPPELSVLVARAPLIVDASLEATFPSYLQTSIPRTDAVFRVSRVVKGTFRVGDQVLIAQLGNEGTRERSKGRKLMQLGERYVLFLQPMRPDAVDQFPVRAGLTRYGSISRDDAVKINGSKIEINPEMPFHGSLNGRGLDEFFREVTLLAN